MEENVLDLVEQKNISENSLRSWRHPVAFGFVWAHWRKDVMKTLDPLHSGALLSSYLYLRGMTNRTKGMRWYVILALVCISMVISAIEHLFMYLLTIYASLEKMSMQVLCSPPPCFFKKIWLFELFCYWVVRVPYIFDIWFANIFSHSIDHFFISLFCYRESF